MLPTSPIPATVPPLTRHAQASNEPEKANNEVKKEAKELKEEQQKVPGANEETSEDVPLSALLASVASKASKLDKLFLNEVNCVSIHPMVLMSERTPTRRRSGRRCRSTSGRPRT